MTLMSRISAIGRRAAVALVAIIGSVVAAALIIGLIVKFVGSLAWGAVAVPTFIHRLFGLLLGPWTDHNIGHIIGRVLKLIGGAFALLTLLYWLGEMLRIFLSLLLSGRADRLRESISRVGKCLTCRREYEDDPEMWGCDSLFHAAMYREVERLLLKPGRQSGGATYRQLWILLTYRHQWRAAMDRIDDTLWP